MNHLSVLGLPAYQTQKLASKTLIDRATGNFYTPHVIANAIIGDVIAYLALAKMREVEIIDPFAGDGRLLAWLLEQAATRGLKPKWRVSIWDINKDAVLSAKQTILAVAKRVGAEISISAWSGDSFERIATEGKRFNVVITNPPWDVLKPDRREIEGLTSLDHANYLRKLETVDSRLSAQYPTSQPLRKFAGWGTNLSRVGVEAAARLLVDKGILGLVAPASLLADQVSTPLRQWMFESIDIRKIAYFPAEGRYFEGVDQPAVAFAGIRSSLGSTNVQVQFFNDNALVDSTRSLNFSRADLEQDAFRIHFHGDRSTQAVLKTMRSHTTWGGLEQNKTSGLWSGRELDETGRARYLRSRGAYPFVKGRMVGRFGILEKPSEYVSPTLIQIPHSASLYRLVWRDVSRITQKRRMQATIIPPKWVTGNSLNAAYFRDNDLERLTALAGVVNSVAFEAQIRSMLSTAHVSVGIVRAARLPDLDRARTRSRIAELTQACLDGALDLQPKLEVAVAKAFNLSRDAFEILLSSFPKIEENEKDALLSKKLWPATT